MRARIVLSTMLVIGIVFLWGCETSDTARAESRTQTTLPQRHGATQTMSRTAEAAASPSTGLLQRPSTVTARSAPVEGGASAVEQAVMWSAKYAGVVQELRVREATIRDLEDANRETTAKAAALDAQLAKTREELEGANEFLVLMRDEIDKWKADVLGFREEMRKAQNAQMRALAQVLKLLGAVESAAAPEEDFAVDEETG